MAQKVQQIEVTVSHGNIVRQCGTADLPFDGEKSQLSLST